MTAPTRPAGVTVAMVLDELARGSPPRLDVELLAGKSGVRPARHQSLPAEDRAGAVGLRRRGARRPRAGVRRERDPLPRIARRRRPRRDPAPAVLPRHSRGPHHPGIRPAGGAVGRPPTVPPSRCCARATARPTRCRGSGSALDNLLAPRTTIHGVLMDILGPGRARHRRERHRQERVRPRPGRPRPPAGGRRRGGAALPRRVVRARQLSRADPPSHGDPRPRPDQHPGSVRRRLDAHLEAGRAGRPARTLGAGPRVRSARPRRCALRRARRADPDDPHAGGAGPQHRHPGRGGGAQPAAAGARRARGAGRWSTA